MLNINEEDLKKAIVERASDELLERDDDLSSLVQKEIKARVDTIFKDRAEAQIQAEIDAAILSGFEREYQRVDPYGTPAGAKTSIRAELNKVVDGYWSAKVDPRSGKPTESDYTFVTRAAYLMTTICAQDFSEKMKQDAQNIAGHLKDGLRTQMAQQMDRVLDGLFHIKSLADQGKVEKPW